MESGQLHSHGWKSQICLKGLHNLQHTASSISQIIDSIVLIGIWKPSGNSIFKDKHNVTDCMAACAGAWKHFEFQRRCTDTESLLSAPHRDLRSWKRCQHAFNLAKAPRQERAKLIEQRRLRWRTHLRTITLIMGTLQNSSPLGSVSYVWKNIFEDTHRETQEGCTTRGPKAGLPLFTILWEHTQ